MGYAEIEKARLAAANKTDKVELADDENHPENKPEETDFYKTEGIRNTISKLEIYNAAGGSIAIDYSMMPIIYCASGEEIIIPTMVNLKVTITGNNLERLRKRLIDNRVKWVRPYFGTKPPLSDNELFIEKIKIEAAAFEDVVEKLIQ